MNFSTTFLKALQKAELQILATIVFRFITTAGKKAFLNKFVFVLKRGIYSFEHFS